MINLLSEKKIVFDKQVQSADKVKTWSGVVLVAYIVIIVLSVVVAQVYAIRMDKTKKALNAAKLELASKVLVIQKYDSMIERAEVIKQILTKRRESIDLWNTVRGLLPTGVELTRFGLAENKLSLGFLAPHVVTANQMIDVIETQFKQLKTKATVVDLSRQSDASYAINAEVTLQ